MQTRRSFLPTLESAEKELRRLCLRVAELESHLDRESEDRDGVILGSRETVGNSDDVAASRSDALLRLNRQGDRLEVQRRPLEEQIEVLTASL